MVNKFWFVVLMAGSALACAAASELPSAREGSREASKRNAEAVLGKLRDVIYFSDKSVRLYYCASCHPGDEDPPPFPFVKVQAPSKGGTGLAAVREIFKNDKNVTVKEEPVGIIRVWIGKVPTAILQTKLSSLTLDRPEQYNPDLVIRKIVYYTKEMQAAEDSLGFVPPIGPGGTVVEPSKGFPYLPASIRNVTVERVLDMIARTWAGEGSIVTYGACARSREMREVGPSRSAMPAMWCRGDCVK